MRVAYFPQTLLGFGANSELLTCFFHVGPNLSLELTGNGTSVLLYFAMVCGRIILYMQMGRERLLSTAKSVALIRHRDPQCLHCTDLVCCCFHWFVIYTDSLSGFRATAVQMHYKDIGPGPPRYRSSILVRSYSLSGILIFSTEWYSSR